MRSRERAEELEKAGVDLVVGDIRDPAVVRDATKGVDTVYHLAAVFRRAGVPDSEYREVHVDATRQLVEASAAAGVRRVVHCSTVGVHGSDEGDAPATESAPLKPSDIVTGTEAPTLNELVGEIAKVAHVSSPRFHLPVWPFWLAGAVCEAVCIPFGIEPPIFRRRVKFFTSNRWFDTSKARRELGFAPRVRLRDGLSQTLESYRQLGWV